MPSVARSVLVFWATIALLALLPILVVVRFHRDSTDSSISDGYYHSATSRDLHTVEDLVIGEKVTSTTKTRDLLDEEVAKSQPSSLKKWIANDANNTLGATSVSKTKTATMLQSHNNKPSWPSLDTIIDYRGRIIGDVQFLLDFAILGFGKCGTSTLMRWLGAHTSEVLMLPAEDWSLYYKQPANLISQLYYTTDLLPLPSSKNGAISFKEKKMRAYKAPSDIRKAHVLRYYRTLWPKTKLMVGVRHPVYWFQSLYNFRIQNMEHDDAGRPRMTMSHPNAMMRSCTDETIKLCASMGHFAYYLLQLGKQHLDGPRPFSKLEKEIVTRYYNEDDAPPLAPEDILYMPNDIFLFDVAQLEDANETRQHEFRQDVKSFLGFQHDLAPVSHVTPGKKWNAAVQAAKDAKKIDICEDEFIPLRRHLMHLSRLSSQWIRTVFLDLPKVHVSSRRYLEDIMLDSWMHDPCGDKSDLVTQAESDAIFRATVFAGGGPNMHHDQQS